MMRRNLFRIWWGVILCVVRYVPMMAMERCLSAPCVSIGMRCAMGRSKYRKIRYQPFLGSGGILLPPNQAMQAGHFIKSENGRFILRLRSDGNLVLEDGGPSYGWQTRVNLIALHFGYELASHSSSLSVTPDFYMILSDYGSGPLSPLKHWIGPTGKTTILR